MKKSKLILAVFFSVMLENIVAMVVPAQVAHQQLNQTVAVGEITYSNYNLANQTIEINGEEHSLIDFVPQIISQNHNNVIFADYLRFYHAEVALNFGLFNEVQQLPPVIHGVMPIFGVFGGGNDHINMLFDNGNF